MEGQGVGWCNGVRPDRMDIQMVYEAYVALGWRYESTTSEIDAQLLNERRVHLIRQYARDVGLTEQQLALAWSYGK